MDEIATIVSEVFDISREQINKESGPDNIEKWDSLGQLSLILAIEKKYKITLEIHEMFEIMNVGDIYDLLRKRSIV